MQTQNERLIIHLLDGHKITSLEAWQKLGISRLASRINEVGKEIQIKREWVEVQNRFGEKCRVKEYFL